MGDKNPEDKKVDEKADQKVVSTDAATPAEDSEKPGSVDEAPAEGDARPKQAAQRGKARGTVFGATGIAHIRATFNNTMVTISDIKGRVCAWSTAGRAGFKGSRKSTAFAAGVVGQEAARQALARGVREVEVRVQGPGAGRETAIRSLQSSGLLITMIKDVTPIPHNGCRPRKRRRV